MQCISILRNSLLVAVATAALPAPAAADWSPRQWDQASSLGRDLVVGGAIGVPAVQADWRATGQSALAIGGASAVTGLLKYSVHEIRPDGSDRHSFPSGHTSASFAAAASLEQRYGWKVGVPAHLLAAFVGLARVEADKHYWHDVIIGAAIGEAAGLLLVDKHRKRAKPPIGAGLAVRF